MRSFVVEMSCIMIKGLYKELRDNYYKYPAQLPPLTWLNDSVPAAPEGIKVERLDDELHLTWQKPVSEKQDLTYTVYYSLTDSIDTASAKSILATNIYGNELFLPIDVESERGVYIFCNGFHPLPDRE